MSSAKPTRGKVIVSGILFFYPLAGVTYQFLHYLIGLRRLGYDAYYVEDSARWVYDPVIHDMSPDAASNIRALLPILERHGFADRWAFRGAYEGGKCYGMSEAHLAQLYRDADALLNVTGAQEIRDEHRVIKRRIYVESDPFSSQVQVANGDAGTIAALDAHDAHFTFGENIGAADCGIPSTPYRWLPTRQPVVMDLWENSSPPGDTYNTITTWRNTNKDVVYQGPTYHWTKDREFEKVLDLPRRRPGLKFELATGVSPEVAHRLAEMGWARRDSVGVSADVDRYRNYIQQSRGEFTVAREQYVRPRTGWFSDRTVCYLGAGRPVITQETGFSKYVTSGRGLFGFRAMDDILAAVDAIETDPVGHGQAAREVAVEYFAAEKVVGSLMSRAGL